jgi:MurNAc alpha-1-phosphate uridylyltransferase
MIPNPPFRPQGDFSLLDGRVGTLPAPRYTYSGIALIDPRLVEGITAGTKAPLAPLLKSAAEQSLLGGEVYEGLWNDVGTHERLAELDQTLKRHLNEKQAS